jgi:hypothetical protein
MQRDRFLGVAIIIAGTLVAASVAFASIPGPDGTIHGCYLKSGGRLRVIDKQAEQKCTSKERPLSWSQQGPSGPPGVQGDPGQDGATIAQRVRLATSPFVLDNQGNAPGALFDLALTSNSYVQPDDTLSIVYLSVSAMQPVGCDMAAVVVKIRDNGVEIVDDSLQPQNPNTTVNKIHEIVLFEDSGSHVYTARAAGCDDATVDVAIDVVEII